MMRRMLFALGTVVVASFSTVVAFAPVSRALSKMGGEYVEPAQWAFMHKTLPSLALAMVIVALAVILGERRPVMAIVLLLAAPVAALMAGLILQ